MHHFLILALFLLAATAGHAQVLMPRSHSLKFRLYGKAGKPILAHDKDYRVEVESASSDEASFTDSLLVFRGSEFDMTPKALTIVHGNEKMRLVLGGELDSIPFRNGTYEVPAEFIPVLRKGSAGLQPKWSDFILTKKHELLQINRNAILRFQPIQENDRSEILTATATPSGEVLCVVRGLDNGERTMLIGNARDASWRRASIPIAEDVESEVWFTPAGYGRYRGKSASGPYHFATSADGGETWSALEANAIEDSEPLGRNPPTDSPVELTYSSNGRTLIVLRRTKELKVWKTVARLDAPPNALGLRVFDEHVAAILSTEFVLLTRDGGETWRYLPLTDSRSGAIVAEDGSARLLLNAIGPQDFRFVSPELILVYGPRTILTIRLPR